MGAALETSRRTGGRNRVRVLVVDDSVDHRALITRRLQGAGMEVTGAGNADEALERIDDVDLVLLDYRLPGVSGLEVLAAIRARHRPPSVVMVTGAGSTEVAVEAMRAGAVNYVPKDRGYIQALPEVVERAWQHHDLALRAAELQRLALLVTSTTDRDELFEEIVAGAARLLRADSCALLVNENRKLEIATVFGTRAEDLEGLVVVDLDVTEADEPRLVDGRLLIPLPSETGEQVGLLALAAGTEDYTEEELQLAKVFASFAGIALRNLRQFELERRLVTELQQTLDARRDFVASISHELRTPLTSIAGFTATLEKHWEEFDPAQRGDLLRRVGRNAEELRNIVEELLDLAGVERGRDPQVHLETLLLSSQVHQTIDALEHVLGGRDVTLDIAPVEVTADPSLLRRCLGNLLSNAVKFSEPGTGIDVRAVTVGSMVRIEVTDHGIGLPAWEAARVFDPFFRARSSVANAIRGSGIGLALVREYVHTMGGEVHVRSAVGEGSTFSFTLPLG
jgi:signal transduction histidine kinase